MMNRRHSAQAWLTLLALLALLCDVGSAIAATYVSRATGNWNAGGTWARLRTGTITTSTSSTTVTGVGTLFTTQLAAGNQLFTAAGGAAIGTISSITNNTTLVLTANATSNNTGIAYYATTATTPVAGDTVTVNSPNTVTVSAAAAATTVTVNSGGTLTANAGLTISGAVSVSGIMTIATATGTLGSLTVPTGGSFRANNDTIINGATSVDGTLNIANAAGTIRRFIGAVSINTGGVWNNSVNEPVEFRGGLAINGTTFTAGSGIHTFNTNAQAISSALSAATTITIPRITVTGVTLTNSITPATLDITTQLAGVGGTLSNSGNLHLGMTAANLSIANLTASAVGNTVEYNLAGAQTVKLPTGAPATYYDLTLSGSGAKTMPGTAMTISNDFTLSGTATATAAQALTIGQDFTIGASNTFSGSTFTHNIARHFTKNGTFTANTSTINFNGSGAQTFTATTATTFSGLSVNKPSGGDLTIACGTPSPTVNATLTLTAGKIITSGTSPDCFTTCPTQVPIIVGVSPGTIAGGNSTSYVQGALRKNFGSATLNFRATGDEFPVGDATNYTPIEITAGGTSAAGNLIVCTTAIDHTLMTEANGGGIDTTKSVNRYWSMTSTGLNLASGGGSALMAAKFKFAGGDVDGIATTGNFIIERHDGADWHPTTLIAANPTDTDAQNINLTVGSNDFQIGEPLARFPPVLGNFNAFDTTAAAGAVIGNIQTKQDGIAFSLRIVRLLNNAVNTGYGTAGVTVELYDASDNSGGYTAGTACRTTWTTVIPGSSQTVSFTAGVATANFTIANTYRDVRVHVNKTGGGAGRGCSSDRFAIRPQSITVSAHDTDWQSTGTVRPLATTTATGGEVHAASESGAAVPYPFTLRASPVPAGVGKLYDGNPSLVSGFPVCCTPSTTPACATLPATCATGSLAFTTPTPWTAAGDGVRENATAHYAEAGVLNLQLEDTAYASVDASDGSSAATRTVPATATAQIGRFVPARFELTAGGTPPVFLTFGAPMCAFSRSFTYIGKSFWFATSPSATLNAVNAAGTVTANYPLDTAPATLRPALSETFADSTAPATAPLNTALVGTPGPFTGSGTATYSPSSGGTLSYTRDTSVTGPVAPFNAAISLTVSASDATETGVSGNATITTPTPLLFNGSGSGIAFDGSDFNTGAGLTGGKTFVYGRLRLGNASGSQLVPLLVPMETQYYSGAPANAFVTNAADQCTSILATNVELGTYTGNLNACETSLTAGTFTNGRATILVSAPGATNNGSVILTARLESPLLGSPNTCIGGSSTPVVSANRAYLQGNWTTTTYTQNPAARATFGVFRGNEEVIDIRENF